MDIKTEPSNRKLAFDITPNVLNMLEKHRVVVVVPAYNEDRFIGSLILKIVQFPLTVLVVDDGSTDHTAFVAEAAGALVVRHEQNMGKGAALNTGICEARLMDPEVIVVIDADGQHLVSELPSLICPILDGEADIVVGSRYLEKTSLVPTHRLLGHWFFNKLTSLASRVNVSDSQSGYRAFSPKAFNTDLFLSSDFSVESEMQFLAHEHGLRITEVPITIRYMDKPKRPVMQQGRMVLNGILHLVGQYRPLLFFGLPGFLIMFGGATMGFLVIDIYRRLEQLAVGYAMISVLLTVIGMVLFSTGIILHSVRGLLIDMLREKGRTNGK
jgi:glycosyltransferase involved in cell wall biosynthesis